MSWSHRGVSANGQRLHVVEQGEGPLVLLVHGFLESWYSWHNQIGALADAGYHAVAPDMRGYGRSSKPPRVDDYRITELVADCVDIVEGAGASSAVVVGHDWGALVAWSAAWTRPDVFRGVVGVSVPFAGRGLVPFAGLSPFGEIRPRELHRLIAGPDKLFYQEYFNIPGALQAELDADVRGFLRDLYFAASGDSLPVELVLPDIDQVTPEEVLAITRSTATCLARGARLRDNFPSAPETLPAWLEEELDFYVEEFERTGVEAALNWYRCIDLDWELLAPFEGRPVEVPALFIGGDADPATLWGSESIRRAREHIPKLVDAIVLSRCGHSVPREKPDAINAILLDFLGELPPSERSIR
jgi:pimeloyl-ACP methyl ester carboxylesterase